MTNLFFLITLFSSLNLMSQDFIEIQDPTVFITALDSKSKTIRSIGASFKEIIYSSIIIETTIHQGALAYEKENKIRWEKFGPNNEVLLFDGNQIKNFKKGELTKRSGADRLTKRVLELIIILINGNYHNSNDFDVIYMENKIEYKVELIPKKNGRINTFKSIELLFSKTNLDIKEFAIFESDLDYIVYRFHNIKYNSTFSPATFTTL